MLRERCPECGLTASDVAVASIGDRVRADLPRWISVLERPDARARPSAEVWSPTEYACHVRDVFELFGRRIQLMLDEDDPEFADWNQDVTAIEDDYAAQDPLVVSRELVEAGLAAADIFDAIPPEAHGRTGRRSNGSSFTVETLAQYFWHDVAHHLHDIGG